MILILILYRCISFCFSSRLKPMVCSYFYWKLFLFCFLSTTIIVGFSLDHRLVWLGCVTSANTFLGPVCCITWHYLCGAHTLLWSVVLLYICTLIPAIVHFRPVYTTGLYNYSLASASLASVYVPNCDIQLYTQYGLPGLCYYITEAIYWCEIILTNCKDQSQRSMDFSALLWFFVSCCCSLIAACWHSPSALQSVSCVWCLVSCFWCLLSVGWCRVSSIGNLFLVSGVWCQLSVNCFLMLGIWCLSENKLQHYKSFMKLYPPKMNRSEKALQHYKSALKWYPKNWNLWKRTLHHYKSFSKVYPGNLNQAKKTLQHYKSVLHTYPEIWNLSEKTLHHYKSFFKVYHENQNLAKKTLQHYKSILKVYPENGNLSENKLQHYK